MRARIWASIVECRSNHFEEAAKTLPQILQSVRADPLLRLMAGGVLLWLGRNEAAQKHHTAAVRHFVEARSEGLSAGQANSEAWAFHELGEIAAGRSQSSQAAALMTVAEIIQPKLHALRASQFAQRLGLTHADHEALRTRLSADYAHDRGWNVIREAFPDLPEKDPATDTTPSAAAVR